jgi:hypothetical protein
VCARLLLVVSAALLQLCNGSAALVDGGASIGRIKEPYVNLGDRVFSYVEHLSFYARQPIYHLSRLFFVYRS